jgi:hypothetical protein
LNSLDENMDSDGSCSGFTLTDDAMLDILANYGGPTETHALKTGSPAIDAAPDCTTTGGSTLAADQRGEPRPGGPVCDLGAYEDKIGTPLPAIPYVEFTRVLDCRLEPTSSSRALTSFQPDDTVEVIGRNINRTWYQVASPNLEEPCWVWAGGVDFFGDPDSVQIVPSRGADEDEDEDGSPDTCQPPPGGCPQLQAPQCWDKKKCMCVPCN